MQIILLAAIIATGALGSNKRIPSTAATGIVIALAVIGVFTSPDMTSRLIFVVAAFVGPLVPYALGLLGALTVQPLLHYLRFRIDAHRTHFALPPDDPRYVQASTWLDAHVNEALAAGFQSHGRIAIETGTMTGVSEFLERDHGRIWAFVTAMLPDSPLPPALHCSARLATGEYLVVGNIPHVDPNPPAAGYVIWRLPNIGRISELIRATEAIAAKRGSLIPMPLDTDLVTRAGARTKYRFEAERQLGYHRFDAKADVYRPTLKGAYRQFWVSLPPLNGLIDRRERERERALLAEIGLTPAPRADASTAEQESTPPITRKWALQTAALVFAFFMIALWGPELLAALNGNRFDRSMPRVDVPANLSVPDSFSGAVRTLEEIVGRPSHQLSGTVDDSPAPTRGVAISMRMDSAAAYVSAAQDAFLAKGFYLFATGERFSGLDTDGLALYPTRDPYEIMRAMDTNGANHGLLVDDVIAWFRREEAQNPVRFTAIGFDYVGGRLSGDLPDASGYASRFIAFCPDLKGESITVRWLARDLQRTREIYCWWD